MIASCYIAANLLQSALSGILFYLVNIVSHFLPLFRRESAQSAEWNK
jgi:hypothetical protein